MTEITQATAYQTSHYFALEYKSFAERVANCDNDPESCPGPAYHCMLLSQSVFALFGTLESYLNELYIYYFNCNEGENVPSIETFSNFRTSDKVNYFCDITKFDSSQFRSNLYTLRSRALHFYPLYKTSEGDCKTICNHLEVGNIVKLAEKVSSFIEHLAKRQSNNELVCIYPENINESDVNDAKHITESLKIHICSHASQE